MKLLIADDSKEFCDSLHSIFTSQGWDAEIATTTDQALDIVARKAPALDLVLLDIEFCGETRTGMDVLEYIRKQYPLLPVVMISGKGTLEIAVRATKLGAENFIDKATINSDYLIEVVRQAARYRHPQPEKQELLNFLASHGIIAQSDVMVDVADKILRYGRTDINVLITGETGTGKRLVANALHAVSRRNKKKFVVVDIPNIPHDLFQAELFGCVRGAYTGAVADRRGFFHEADGGTLFLDEIGDLHPSLQANLLVPIQDKLFYRVGSTTPEHADIRFISATDRDLVTAIKENRFRDQLYYRLREVEITLPPLRERREDIPLIAHHTIKQLNTGSQYPKALTPRAEEYLMSLSWPGNVRELISVIRAAYAHVGEQELITEATIREITRMAVPAFSFASLTPEAVDANGKNLDHAVAVAERTALVNALTQTKGNVTKAAALLGKSRETVYALLRKYGIKASDFRRNN